ncbi:hypothetical protein IV203_012342 [Nitzschia inconspicua]|uniref:Uncharacterized protein n=1 Tax=Nitzschia inconspicua TaxID=303405 RepID=A0A9K3KTQ0_9STRA|nr:hypothetical protein IV203_012342 [Nitzschia inconspicua]
MIASKFSLFLAFLAATCVAETVNDSNLRRKVKKTSFCKPVAVSIDAFTGLPNYDTDVYFTAVTNGAPLDAFALQAIMPASYNGIVDCSYMIGSIRELLECEVVEGAESDDPNAILVKCAYMTNTKDGDTVIEPIQDVAVSRCACACGGDQALVGLMIGSECNCFCQPQKNDCECMAPDSTEFITAINGAYSNSTMGETVDARVTRIYEVELLDFEECGSQNTTTFNITAVCPGLESSAFSSLFTTPPSTSPTGTPSDSPTSPPTESPTESPTDSPTKSPTASPIATPETDSPTNSPKTPSPTTSPKTDSPTTSPKTPSPTTSPKTDSPTTSPKTNSPTTSPKTPSPTDSPTEGRPIEGDGDKDGGEPVDEEDEDEPEEEEQKDEAIDEPADEPGVRGK